MVKILKVPQAGLKEISEKGVWQDFTEIPDKGQYIDGGERSFDIIVGLLLLRVLAFLPGSDALKWIQYLFAREIKGEDLLKIISIFTAFNYVVNPVLIGFSMSVAGMHSTIPIIASAVFTVLWKESPFPAAIGVRFGEHKVPLPYRSAPLITKTRGILIWVH